MCGIGGFWSKSLSGEERSQIAEKIRLKLHHRGPNSSGQWLEDPHLALVHTRLSVLDLSPTGHQPMVSQDGRWVLSFNGEIYNYRELRSELVGRGVDFRGTSDTEVLLGAIQVFGWLSTLQRLRGMFAIALWNREERSLSLARDRFGEKPLYYGWIDGNLFFGSELKALMGPGSSSLEMDPHALGLFLKYSYIPSPNCIFKGIRKLPPGHTWVWKEGDPQIDLTPTPFWSLHREAAPMEVESDELVLDQLESRLKEVLSLQLRSDVPLGCFLSGGLDSSLITALAQEQMAEPLNTFSIGFTEKSFDESSYARQVAARLGTKHQDWILSDREILSVIPNMGEIYDEPFADSSQLPTTLLSRWTKNSVTVSLSGDGGDELFGGYNRYFWAERLWKFLKWIPPGFESVVGGAMQPALNPRWGGVLDGLFEGIVSHPQHKIAKIYEILHRSHSREELYDQLIATWSDVDDDLAVEARAGSLLQGERFSGRFVEEMMTVDARTYLPDDIMTKVDRASMSVALEVRAPFLDHQLFEWVRKLPFHFKVRHGQGKWLVRQLLLKRLPKELVDRPKTGFGVPLEIWFRGPLRSWIQDLLTPERIRSLEYVDEKKVSRMLSEHLSGKRNWQYRLWNLAMLLEWQERWIKN